jgi:hypothetical protein
MFAQRAIDLGHGISFPSDLVVALGPIWQYGMEKETCCRQALLLPQSNKMTPK